MKQWITGTLLVALLMVVFLSPLASTSPDGLERVAEELGFAQRVIEPMFQAPIPDYAFPGMANDKLATSISGLLGTMITFGAAYGLSRLARLKHSCNEVNRL